MEEYADLDLTVAAFRRVLDEPAYRSTAGRHRAAGLPARLARRARAHRRVGAPPVGRRRGAGQGPHRQGRQPGDGAGRRRAARLGAGAVRHQGRRRRQLQAAARPCAATGVGRRGARRRGQPQPVRRGVGADAARRAARRSGGRRSSSRCSRAWRRPRPGPCTRRPAACCCTARSSATTSSRPASPTSPGASTRTPSPDNFLRAMFTMTPGFAASSSSRPTRFRAAVADRHDVSTAAAAARRRPSIPTRRSPDVRQRARHRLHRRRQPASDRRRRWPPASSARGVGPDGDGPDDRRRSTAIDARRRHARSTPARPWAARPVAGAGRACCARAPR